MQQITLIDKCSLAIFSGVVMSFSNPFDLVRFRMQATPELIKQAKIKTPYASIAECAKTIYHQQGIKSFWKGNTSNLLRYYPNQSMNFFFKNFFQKTIKTIFSPSTQNGVMAANTLGGTLGGIMTRLILYPFDYTRTKMSNDVTGKEGGIIKNLYSTLQKQGPRGVYRGALISFYGISIFRGTYFGIYDSFKVKKFNQIEKWLLSYFSYVTATFLTYPTDTVRRRLIMTSCANYKYKGFFDCLKRVVKQEGAGSLYRGGSIMFLQALSGSTIYYIFDKLFKNMSEINH